jgi:1-acyl-sn-glycerol-3-phosphate acyltransferase
MCEGASALGPGPFVLLSNHVSLLDIPAVCAAFPGRVRFVAKQELRSVPGFGRAMERAGVVFVDRADRQRAITQLEGAKALLRAGTSVWIAAEGARSRDGRLYPFKKGGFHLARALGVPMVPVWIAGARNVLPADQLLSTTGQTVTVWFGPPQPAPGDGPEALQASMTRLRAEMLALARQAGDPPSVDVTDDRAVP